MITTRAACDLDGVLIDSHEALKKSYLHAGASGWKPNTPWRMFATKHQHEKKNLLYADYLKQYGKVLPLAEIADTYEWDVITGASPEAVSLVRNIFKLNLRFCYTGIVDIKERIALLKKLGTGVYVDDCEAHVNAVRKEIPSCQTLLMGR